MYSNLVRVQLTTRREVIDGFFKVEQQPTFYLEHNKLTYDQFERVIRGMFPDMVFESLCIYDLDECRFIEAA